MENIQEVVTELENQPETNLLPEEVEEKFSQLMVRRVGGEREVGGGGRGGGEREGEEREEEGEGGEEGGEGGRGGGGGGRDRKIRSHHSSSNT